MSLQKQMIYFSFLTAIWTIILGVTLSSISLQNDSLSYISAEELLQKYVHIYIYIYIYTLSKHRTVTINYKYSKAEPI